jgi:hypothetical protein
MTRGDKVEVSAWQFDFLGDLAQDTHGVWEMFAFIRLHHPDFTQAQIFGEAVKSLRLFRKNGWVDVAKRQNPPTDVKTWP